MIQVVIPTIRQDSIRAFIGGWAPLFNKYGINPIIVLDGDTPVVMHKGKYYTSEDILGEDADLIYNKNDGVRNLGFAYIAKNLPKTQYIITLDDDTLPAGDSILNHINTLNKSVPTSWISTASEYMRGFPYKIREESEVVLSHGLWEGVKDWDAPTQLVNGNKDVNYYVGPIPKGILYPMCGMNIAFKKKLLPYMYYAPMGYKVNMDRFADIWTGIYTKRVIDSKGWAVYTGGSFVEHSRASNVWKNLQKEVKGLELNESFWEGDMEHPYFKEYAHQALRWEDKINALLS